MYTGQVSVAWLGERLSISYTLLRLPSNLIAFSFSVLLVCGVGSAGYFVYLKRGSMLIAKHHVEHHRLCQESSSSVTSLRIK